MTRHRTIDADCDGSGAAEILKNKGARLPARRKPLLAANGRFFWFHWHNWQMQGLTGRIGRMVYPAAGVPLSTGSAWGSSYTVGTTGSDLCCVLSSGALPAVSAANLTGFPTLIRTRLELRGLSGSPSITVNAVTATTYNGAAFSGTFTGAPTFSGNIAFSGTPTFSNTLALNTSGNAGTSTALAATPSLCSTGSAPTGVTAGGDATGCASITGGGVAPGNAVYLNANSTTSASTTLISTGITFSIAASTSYTLDCSLQMKVSTTATNGFSVGVNGPGTPTQVTVAMDNWTSQTAHRSEWSQGTAWAVRLGATATTYSTNPLPIRVTGLIENGTMAGMLTVEFSNVSTTGTVTVYRGSWCKLQ